jgi:hypothetical protein
MSLGKVHKLKPFGSESRRARFGNRETFCGLAGSLCPGFSTEFDTDEDNRFEATDGNDGVTCLRCRKGRWPRTDDATARPYG